MSLARRKTRERGFSTIEMLVAGVVGALLVVMVMQLSMWLARTNDRQRCDLALVRESKLAADAIAQDYGQAIAVRSLAGSSIQFNLDGPPFDEVADWGSSEVIIEYYVSGGRLIRRDVQAATERTVATHMQTLNVRPEGVGYVIDMATAFRQSARTVTLVLSGNYPQ